MDPHAYLSQALSQWQRQKQSGQPMELEELCGDHPELLTELRRRISTLERMDQIARSSTISTVRSVEDAKLAGRPADETAVELQTRFRQVEHVKSGGLGDVFKARDADLGRAVALKFLQKRFVDDPLMRSQFLLEAEITSQLDHPGVVPIFGFGLKEGQPFYAMRFLGAGTLEQAVQEFHNVGHYSLTRLKGLVGHFKSACETIAYAHSRGIVHCDLKPGNILMGKYGETLVADWGSALMVDRDGFAKESGEQTLRPQSLGDLSMTSSSSTRPFTPAYMAPEQIPDDDNTLGTRTDIYCLGATLYHLITGRHQLSDLYDGNKPTREEIFDYLREGRTPRPRAVNKHVPPALEAICRKAMALKPSDRYANAMEMARDLEAWRTDGRVSAYQEPVYEKLSRSARRHPLAAQMGLIGGLLVLLLTLGAALLFFSMAGNERIAKEQAAKERDELALVAARLSAQRLSEELATRWRILTFAAEAPELRDEMKRLPAEVRPTGDFPAPKLQAWLEQQKERNKSRGTSWVILDERGRLVARTGLKRDSKTFGESFRFRDFFHGCGFDCAKAEEGRYSPLQKPHRSVIYPSRSTGEILLTLSLPIRAGVEPEAPILGVLGMSLRAETFMDLHPAPKAGLDFSLVDLKAPAIEGTSLKSVFVFHHCHCAADGKKAQPWKAMGLPEDLAASLRPKCGLRDRTGPRPDGDIASSETQLEVFAEAWQEPYLDPFDEQPKLDKAAFAPVVIRDPDRGWNEPTGLLVIIEKGLTTEKK